MKVIINISIEYFKAWSGAKVTRDRIVNEGKVDLFDDIIEELYPDGIDETLLNDILWFDRDWVYESLGIEY